MYNDKRWRGTEKTKGLRQVRLDDEPLCRECKKANVLTVATDVDHIIPHRGDWGLFLDYDNTQSLCHACHSRKTTKEGQGFGNG